MLETYFPLYLYKDVKSLVYASFHFPHVLFFFLRNPGFLFFLVSVLDPLSLPLMGGNVVTHSKVSLQFSSFCGHVVVAVSRRPPADG
jgi:hypothetical protein